MTAKAKVVKAAAAADEEDLKQLLEVIETQRGQIGDFKNLISTLKGIISNYEKKVEDLENEMDMLEGRLAEKEITIAKFKAREMELLKKIDDLRSAMQVEIQRRVETYVSAYLDGLEKRITSLENNTDEKNS